MIKGVTDLANESEAERLGRLYPIILSEYKPGYAQAYLEEKSFLETCFGDSILRINHIGSTAVPNLISKPTIDIFVEIKNGFDRTAVTKQLTKKGYIVFHIHVRELADHNELYFRDYLIAHPEAAKEYGELKRALQQKYRHDRDGYTDAKSAFIHEATKRARYELKDRYSPIPL